MLVQWGGLQSFRSDFRVDFTASYCTMDYIPCYDRAYAEWPLPPLVAVSSTNEFCIVGKKILSLVCFECPAYEFHWVIFNASIAREKNTFRGTVLPHNT